jgi:hypothetical protein
MGIRIRQAPSGKLIVGTVTGQILSWNNTTQEWDVAAAPAPGGGPSWVSTMWVNADAASFVGADGTPGKPFATLQEAHDALPAGGGTIIVVPAPTNGYAANLTTDRSINLVALTIGTMGGITNSVNGIAVGGDVVFNGFLTATGIDFQGNLTSVASPAALKGCFVSGTATIGAALIAEDCIFNACEATEIHAQACTFGGNITINAAVGDFLGCTIGAGGETVTFVGGAGTLQLDSYSNYTFITGVGNIVNGAKAIIGDLTP